jgi:hypothetical protein
MERRAGDRRRDLLGRSPRIWCCSGLAERILQIAPALVREREPDDRVAIGLYQLSRLRRRTSNKPGILCVLQDADQVSDAGPSREAPSGRGVEGNIIAMPEQV